MKLKDIRVAGDPARLGDLVEELNTRLGSKGLVNLDDSSLKASDIERARWDRAAQTVELELDEDALGHLGATWGLTEELIRARAFDQATGIYVAPGAGSVELVYAARRLVQAGLKVACLDWDPGSSDLEAELTSSTDIPVVQILEAAQAREGAVVVHQGAGDLEWTMAVRGVAELIEALDQVDVLIFLAEPTAQQAHLGSSLVVTEDVLAVSAAHVGSVAGRRGASILVAGRPTELTETWVKTLFALVSGVTLGELKRSSE